MSKPWVECPSRTAKYSTGDQSRVNITDDFCNASEAETGIEKFDGGTLKFGFVITKFSEVNSDYSG